MTKLNNYSYRGARAMVLLHEKQLKSFYKTWKKAKAANITLPKVEDKAYRSLDTLMGHVLAAARSYMIWICKQLELPDPDIKPIPEDDKMEVEAESYMKYLLKRWRLPLVNVPEEKFEPQTYAANWGTHYCIDAMLEHAVMHPIRHEFQLRELMKSQKG
jgi:hypothetical protein